MATEQKWLNIMNTVVLNPQLIGDWRTALAKDALVANAQAQNGGSPGNWSADTISAFSTSLATGCASLLEIARVQSGYNPLDTNQVYNLNAVQNWVNQLKDGIAPNLFTVEYENSNTIGGVNNWPGYIAQAIDSYVGITDADKARLMASVQNLVQISYSAPNQPETVIMVQHSIQANTDGSASIYFYYTLASIIYSVGSGKNATSALGSTFNIFRVKLNLNFSVYQSMAAQIANRQLQLVKNWLGGGQAVAGAMMFNSVQLHSMSCFEPVPSIVNAKTVGSGNDYWRSFSWEQLPSDAQRLWAVFGWNHNNWDGPAAGFPADFNKSWTLLSIEEQSAAQSLGYDATLWDGPSVSEAILSDHIMNYWKKYAWDTIPTRLQTLWVKLGWDSNSWSGAAPAPATATTAWANLSAEQQKTAGLLGFSPGNWGI
jgi:hypothetical protein